jgi:excisionase family DNA binding protein
MKYFNTPNISKQLDEIKSLILNSQSEYIPLDKAAEYLQFKKSYLYNLVSQKRIPHYKPNGKKVYFNKLELNLWIQQSKIKSIYEIEEQINLTQSGFPLDK